MILQLFKGKHTFAIAYFRFLGGWVEREFLLAFRVFWNS